MAKEFIGKIVDNAVVQIDEENKGILAGKIRPDRTTFCDSISSSVYLNRILRALTLVFFLSCFSALNASSKVKSFLSRQRNERLI